MLGIRVLTGSTTTIGISATRFVLRAVNASRLQPWLRHGAADHAGGA